MTEETKIETVGNHIYFYYDIVPHSILDLTKQMRELDAKLLNDRYVQRLEKPIPIWLHILSYGGDVDSSFAAVDMIHSLGSPVYSIVEGIAASGATLLSMAASKRFITPHSTMMIHQLSGWAYGTYEQIKDAHVKDDINMSNIIRFYSDNSQLSEKKIRKMLKRDCWFDANTAVEYGFCDEVYK